MRYYRQRAWIIGMLLLAGVAQAVDMQPDAGRKTRPEDHRKLQLELALSQLMAKAVVLGMANALLVLPTNDMPLYVFLMKQLQGT